MNIKKLFQDACNEANIPFVTASATDVLKELKSSSARRLAELIYNRLASLPETGWVHGNSFLPTNVLCDYYGQQKLIALIETTINQSDFTDRINPDTQAELESLRAEIKRLVPLSKLDCPM